MVVEAAPVGARARVRAELTGEIKAAARRQLAEHGPSALSLRAIARELGMVSSALYRYFPSRDDLLTALIIDAYDAVGTAAAEAEASVRRGDLARRWAATTQAMRRWALANPHEYGLIFGSPVPGYAAPADTIDPATRIPLLLVGIVVDGTPADRPVIADGPPMPRPVRADLRALRDSVAPTLPEEQAARAVMAWTELVGSISFELFGHLNNVVHDYEAYFDYQMRRVFDGLALIDPKR
jgi:AcrR family transcriptional regulator